MVKPVGRVALIASILCCDTVVGNGDKDKEMIDKVSKMSSPIAERC